jgi:hypothetical protein
LLAVPCHAVSSLAQVTPRASSPNQSGSKLPHSKPPAPSIADFRFSNFDFRSRYELFLFSEHDFWVVCTLPQLRALTSKTRSWRAVGVW